MAKPSERLHHKAWAHAWDHGQPFQDEEALSTDASSRDAARYLPLAVDDGEQLGRRAESRVRRRTPTAGLVMTLRRPAINEPGRPIGPQAGRRRARQLVAAPIPDEEGVLAVLNSSRDGMRAVARLALKHQAQPDNPRPEGTRAGSATGHRSLAGFQGVPAGP